MTNQNEEISIKRSKCSSSLKSLKIQCIPIFDKIW